MGNEMIQTKVCLLGGNEFDSGCEAVDHELLNVVPEDSKVLILPTAAAGRSPDISASNGVRYFSKLGFQAEVLHVLDRRAANDPNVTASIISAGLIYFTGGSPENLVEIVQETRTWETFKSWKI